MERVRIRRTPAKPKKHLKVLPLDPRDPEIVRAKDRLYRHLPPRGRAA